VADRADIVNGALYRASLDGTTTISLAPFLQNATSTDAMVDYISYVFLHHSMSPVLTQQAMDAANAASTPEAQLKAALYVVLTSGEYQIIQ